MSEDRTRIAVIGMGPRGLGALEALAERLPGRDIRPQIDVFDPFPAPGAGPNFDPDESEVCRLNLPIRDIGLEPPEFSDIGHFSDWLDEEPNPDRFPTRASLGHYLQARLQALTATGLLHIRLVQIRVDNLKQHDTGWSLLVDQIWCGPYDEVLMVPGQPKVEPDDQLADWQRRANGSEGTLATAYPARRLERQAADWAGRTVAIRGLALSTFDVIRVLTVSQGGRFEDGRYVASGREPARIVPFSLDGAPPFPKPDITELDARFAPTEQETGAFLTAAQNAATATPEGARTLINEALSPVVTRVLRDSSVKGDGVDIWLETEWKKPGTQEQMGTLQTLRSGIAMAEGSAPPSIGYVVGQVWRKWQNELRQGYNPAETPPETAEALLGFDESLKRYSYGTPVSSSRELAALIEAGLVSTDYASDPEIALIDVGWRLSSESDSVEASVMVDAVLPNPDLSAVRADLISKLIEAGKLTPVAEGLGAHTDEDATVIDRDGNRSKGLCLLGRLSLGSVVAADSLHDCFGAASHRWADGLVRRMNDGR